MHKFEHHTSLEKGASSRVNRLHQTCVRKTDGIGTDPDRIAILLVQFPLRLDMRFLVVVKEAPEV